MLDLWFLVCFRNTNFDILRVLIFIQASDFIAAQLSRSKISLSDIHEAATGLSINILIDDRA